MPVAQRTQFKRKKAIGRPLPVAFLFCSLCFPLGSPSTAEGSSFWQFCVSRLAQWKHPGQWVKFSALSTPQERSHFLEHLGSAEQAIFLNHSVKRLRELLETEQFTEAHQALDTTWALAQGNVERRHLYALQEVLLECIQDYGLPMSLRKKSVALMGSIASNRRFYPPTEEGALPTPALLMLRILNSHEISEQVEVPLQLEIVATLHQVAMGSEAPARLRLARRLAEIAEDGRRPRKLRHLAETCALEMSTLH